jgi:hypothetical protein
MKQITLLFLALLAAPALFAADINLHARVDRDKVVLGDTFYYQLVFELSGQTQFQPQLQKPTFDGFQATGPNQGQNFQWVNGVVTQSITLAWTLVPLRSGKLAISAARVTLKDPAGDKEAEAPAITITVSRGQGFRIPPTPTAASTPAGIQAPAPEDDLRPIKPDLGLPWLRISLIAGVFLAVMAFILYLALRPNKPAPLPVVRDPGQLALQELERLRPLLAQGREEEYFLGAAKALRAYLGQRLRVAEPEPTLYALRRAAHKRLAVAGQAGGEELDACIDILARALYARERPDLKEAAAFPDKARALVLHFESILG